MIRIFLIDDHTILREALRMLLEQDGTMQVVAEAGDGATALRLADEIAADVVIMDIALPGQSGIELTQRLLLAHPALKVLILSTFCTIGVIRQALDAGASGYIIKSAAGTQLIEGVLGVLAGQIYLCPEATQLMVGSLRRRPPGTPENASRHLTKRETEVLTCRRATKIDHLNGVMRVQN